MQCAATTRPTRAAFSTRARPAAAVRLLLLCCSSTLLAPASAFSLLRHSGTPPSSVPEALSRARRWSAPERFGDATGLGGGLVYALDSSFCKTMLPRFLEATQFTDALALTEILSPSYTNCEQVEATIAQAFDSWSANHPHLSFKKDTSDCAGKRDCATTEIFVTVFDEAPDDAPLNGHDKRDKAALAQIVDYSLTPARGLLWAHGSAGQNGSVALGGGGGIAVRRAELRFNQTMCWYLDAPFCARFRAAQVGGVLTSEAMAVIAAAVVAWVVALAYIARVALLVARANGRRADARARWRQHQVPDEAFEGIGRRERSVVVVTKLRPERLALALCVLVVVPLLWQRVALPCLECYDFAASAAHEMGHLLGIGHPNEGPALYPAANSSSGRRDVACGLGGAGALELASARAIGAGPYSIMEPITQFEPKACIGQDDLDALNALYPACDGSGDGGVEGDGASLGPPICAKLRPAGGVARLLGVVFWPSLFISAAAFVAVHLARRRAMGALKAIDGYLDASVVLPWAGHTHVETARRLAELLATTEAEMRAATGLSPSQLFGPMLVPFSRPPPRRRRRAAGATAGGAGGLAAARWRGGPRGGATGGAADAERSEIYRAHEQAMEEALASMPPPPTARERLRARWQGARATLDRWRGRVAAPEPAGSAAQAGPDAVLAQGEAQAQARSEYLSSSLGSLAYIEAVTHAVATRSAREFRGDGGDGGRRRPHMRLADTDEGGAPDSSLDGTAARRRAAGAEVARARPADAGFGRVVAEGDEEEQMRLAIALSLAEAREVAMSREAAAAVAELDAAAPADGSFTIPTDAPAEPKAEVPLQPAEPTRTLSFPFELEEGDDASTSRETLPPPLPPATTSGAGVAARLPGPAAGAQAGVAVIELTPLGPPPRQQPGEWAAAGWMPGPV